MDFAADISQAMNLMAEHSNSYRVEVSGWDAKESFFVERASLDWKERERKTVALRAAVRYGSVLFVRLLRPLGGGAGFPVPYRIVEIEDSAGGARRIVGLEQLQPHASFREKVAEVGEGGAKVA
ncbi:MAG: hypothetical protein WA192_05985 [Candidatus Acidiferrales bacterium]